MLAEGVTVMTPDIGALVKFELVNAGTVPVPAAVAKPIVVFEFTQL